MDDINSITISGRLTADPVFRTTQTGLGVVSFSVANNQSKKVGENWEQEAHFFECGMVGKRSEWLSQNLKKGELVMVEGRIKQNKWTDKDGKNQSKVVISANNVLKTVKTDKAEKSNNEQIFGEDVPF